MKQINNNIKTIDFILQEKKQPKHLELLTSDEEEEKPSSQPK